MKSRIWLKAFCFSVIFHSVALAAVAYGFSFSTPSAEIKEKLYIEVELGEAPSSGQLMENQVEAKIQEAVEHQPQVPIVSRNERAVVPSTAAADESAIQVAETGTIGTASVGVISSSGTVSTGGVSGTKDSSVNGRVGKGGADRPYVVYGPTPQYPNEARTNSWQGTVRVKALVTENGTVQDIRLACGSGYDSLDQAALDGVRRWRFKPAYRDGCPITAWVTVPVIFELN